jgi:zinc transport system substrate-binding protein
VPSKTVARLPLFAACLVMAFLLHGGRVQAAPKVVASLLPLHSLAAQIMEGVGKPALLLEATASPHSYQLRPSEARMLQEADLVIWVGPPMETFLTAPLESLSSPERQLELLELPGLLLHEEGHGGEESDHGDHHHEDGLDAHIWLSPENAAIILKGIAARLSDLDPANAQTYEMNLEGALTGLAGLEEELRPLLAPLGDQAFIVFHDAYGYFLEHYGFEQARAVTLSPERAPGAQKLAELRRLVAENGISCLFAEPQMSPAVLESLARDSGARVASLDPLGVGLEPGPDAYPSLLRGLARDLSGCLSQP